MPDPLTAALADGPLVLRSWIELADALAPDPSTPPTIIHPSARITLASRGSRAGPVDIVHGIDLRVFAVEGTPTSTVLHDLERLL